MTSFLIQNLDFIYVLYGVAFLAMGVLASALVKTRATDPAWRWLQAFGLIHGMNEWLEALTFSWAQVPLVVAVRTTLLLVSFLVLLEFGRRGVPPHFILRRWIYIPALIAAATCLLPDNAMLIRYGLGLPASALAAWTLWVAGRNHKGEARQFHLMAVMFVLYAFFAGLVVPPGGPGLARWLNTDTFLQLTGVPVQIFRMLAMTVVAFALWHITLQRLVQQDAASRSRPLPLYVRNLVFLLLALLMIGGFVTWQAGKQADRNHREHLLDRARAVAATLDPALMGQLTGEPDQEMTRSHRQAVRVLTEVKRISPDVAQVYLYAPRDGQLIFYACSMSSRPQEYYPSGLPYEGEMEPNDWAFFTNGIPYVTGPFRDRWGEWLSAIAPALMSPDGKNVLLALGMDLPATILLHDVRIYRTLGLLLTMALTMLVLDFFARQRQLWLAAQQLASSEEGLRHLSTELEEHVQQRTSELATANRALQQEVVAHRAAELKFRTLTDQLPAITYSVALQPEPHTIYVSPRIQDVLGYSPEEWLTDRALWIRTLHPDDAARVQTVIAHQHRTGQPFDLEYRHLTREGKVRWFRNTARYQADEKGRPVFSHGVMMDITDRVEIAQELKETGERYRLLFENSPVGIFHYDQNLILTRCNQRFADILKSDTHKLLGLQMRKLKDLSVLPALEEALAGRPGHFEGLYQTTTSNVEVWMSMNTGPVLDRNGQPAGGMGIVEDITDRRQGEEERNRNQKLESLGLLAGGIAHDFNNLLTSILGNLSLLKEQSQHPSTSAPEILEDAEHAALRARDLTQQLLTFAKGGTPVKRLTRLDTLISETVSFALRGSASRCDLQIQPDLWAAEVDPGQIAQVVQNLVINADQSMPEGGAIVVRAENLMLGHQEKSGLAEGPYVRIQVADHGVGIPAKNLEHIFDPYFTTKRKGSGLGLTTSFSIVNKHRGRISVQSDVGRGSQFNVYLPASENLRPTEEPIVPAEEKPAQKRRILIMDDESTILAVTTRMLTRAGYEVKTTKHGAEAVAAFSQAMEEQAPFDLVILDLTIPGGMGGRDAFLHLQALDPNVRALVASGYSDHTLSETLALGFAGMVPKPFTVNELLGAVREALG